MFWRKMLVLLSQKSKNSRMRNQMKIWKLSPINNQLVLLNFQRLFQPVIASNFPCFFKVSLNYFKVNKWKRLLLECFLLTLNWPQTLKTFAAVHCSPLKRTELCFTSFGQLHSCTLSDRIEPAAKATGVSPFQIFCDKN